MKAIEGRETIPQLYIEEKLSIRELGRKFGLSPGAISSILTVRGITLRTVSEGLKTKFPQGRFGKIAGNWHGGKTRHISTQIRRKDDQPREKYIRKGEEAAHWKGGKFQIPQGYIYIYQPDHLYTTKRRYVMEHRLVMEKHLGRYLKPNELVHHKNGIKDDNRLENLELLTKGTHVSKHMQDIFEVNDLKQEVARLKKLLTEHNIAYLIATALQ